MFTDRVGISSSIGGGIAIGHEPAKEKREVSQIEVSLNNLDQTLGRLGDLVRHAGSVSSNVCRPSTPQPTSASGTGGVSSSPRPLRSPLAERIDGAAATVDLICNELADLVRRLDV